MLNHTLPAGVLTVRVRKNVGPNSFVFEPTTGILWFFLTNFAQDGGASIALTSSNPAALAVPPSVTVQQGSFISQPIILGPANVDFPTTVTLTASFNGRSQTQDFVAKPATPLALGLLFAATLTCGGQPCTLSTWMRVQVQLNRANVSPETITLTSSNPAICPIQPTLSVPAFSAVNSLPVLDITCTPVAVDTPITYTATLNGVTSTYTATLFKSTDNVAITKAELVVKNLSLKVDAINLVPSDVLTLYNAATGQQIGVMTFSGLSGTGGKYSFQGMIAAPVTTLLLKSALNGSYDLRSLAEVSPQIHAGAGAACCPSSPLRSLVLVSQHIRCCPRTSFRCQSGSPSCSPSPESARGGRHSHNARSESIIGDNLLALARDKSTSCPARLVFQSTTPQPIVKARCPRVKLRSKP